MNVKAKLEQLSTIDRELKEYFDYDTDHCSGFNNHLDEYWELHGERVVNHGPTKKELDTYATDILGLSIKKEYTMIHGDFGTGDTYMMIFDNKKHIKSKK